MQQKYLSHNAKSYIFKRRLMNLDLLHKKNPDKGQTVYDRYAHFTARNSLEKCFGVGLVREEM